MADVYLTRADFWAVNDDCPIRADEWMELTAGDSELSPQPQLGTFFSGWQPAEPGAELALLEWNAGNIVCKSPTRSTVGKLLQLAQRLKGNVQSEEGERIASAEDFSG
jgi:hypothetical protein